MGHGTPPVSVEERKRRQRAVEKAYSDGYSSGLLGNVKSSALTIAARALDLSPSAMYSWFKFEENEKDKGRKDFIPDRSKFKAPRSVQVRREIAEKPQQSWTKGHIITIESNEDDKFIFGAAGDLHAASKYCRWDVREDLYKYFIEEGCVANFDTGNWIDGEASFNRYDLEAHGLNQQIELLARQHPRGLHTYAIWGDDHEGWYVQREGINVGEYAQGILRKHGHQWTDLGYMEAYVRLLNRRSGKSAIMSVVHPGRGSSYALSYAVQKIIESLEGGEKPAVILVGHFHKLWTGLIRNVWVDMTGCQQEQTPWMRKQSIEAHVGGTLVELKQNPKDGAIISMKSEMIRYFGRSYHAGLDGRWSRHGRIYLPPRLKGSGHEGRGRRGSAAVARRPRQKVQAKARAKG